MTPWLLLGGSIGLEIVVTNLLTAYLEENAYA